MDRTICFLMFWCLFCISARSISEKYTDTDLFDERNSNHWRLQAQWALRNKISTPFNVQVAKNVILFLGDGMSISTLAATRVYLARDETFLGEEIKLIFEDFPFTGLAKTYCVDRNVADSACSGTAYLTGVKGNTGTVGLSGEVRRGDCKAQNTGQHSLPGLMAWAQRAKKKTGVVTTTRVTHATPAASYAHAADRRWESDADVSERFPCEDIASQLVRGDVGSKLDVVLGGGRKNFYPKSERDSNGIHGKRNDGANLIDEWVKNKHNLGSKAKYVENREELLNLNTQECDSVLGLFASDHMPYHLEADLEETPSLSEMTQKAIQLLSHENNKGFLLFIEGGRIDTAHHETKAQKALDETAELAKAVDAALKMVNREETLVIVTSDHSHTMTYNGYSSRGSDILGLANKMNASDGLPYSILSYATGPGYRVEDNSTRHNLQMDDMQHLNYTYPSLFPMSRETHGGEDVAVFATGPWSHLFTGNYEQNYIPHAIAYAACIGSGLKSCKV